MSHVQISTVSEIRVFEIHARAGVDMFTGKPPHLKALHSKQHNQVASLHH